MTSIYITILKYLYENDNGDYLDVTKAFKGNKLTSRKHIEQIYDDLKEYIEIESIYNYHGILTLEDESTPETPLFKAKITQKGRDYYTELRNKNVSITISKRNLWIGFAVFLLTLLTFYFSVINPINKTSKEIVIDESTFPNPVLCLKNNTMDTVLFYSRQNFIMWFPVTAYGDAPNVTGTYEFIADTSQIMKGLPFILPNSEMKFLINIENKKKFYNYFTQNENELMLWLKTLNGQLYSSTNLPFNEKWVTKY